MGEQAVALAKAVGYDSAGTVEFVAGQDRSFYFLEMNTRLQVEHPVTEMITGIDLVEQMIRVAAGEKLPFRQSDIRLSGWAVESRIYAEDPYRGFLPSIGRLVKYRPPCEGTSGVSVRNDTGVEEGGEISMYYDPMIAKLVTHAPTRKAAIEAQAQALDAFYIDGIQHNIPFLTAVMQHPRWREGKLSTGFIAEEFPDGFKPRAPEGEELKILAAVATAIDHVNNSRRREITQQMGARPSASPSAASSRSARCARPSTSRGRWAGRSRSLIDEHGNAAEPMEIASSGGRAIRSGRVSCATATSPSRCGRSSTATISPTTASTSPRASTPSAKRPSPR